LDNLPHPVQETRDIPSMMSEPTTKSSDPLWYKDAIIYEVHIKSFFDSNADGVGDLPGLIEKLDYIKDLGVNCLWVLPFYPSPLRDDGYDVADYTSVNSIYGNLDDFKRLLDRAHALGIRVITELVVNHTSDQHRWFQTARKAPAGSPERDFYVWSDSDQKYKDARIIFCDSEGSNWTWDDTAGAYYWHRFFHHQPDLNYDNPQVFEAVADVMRFWFDLGVDGMRLDAIPYLVERDSTNCENLPETHAVLRRLRRTLDQHYSDKMFLAEANQWPEDVRAYFGDGNECHMAYHFPVMPRLYLAVHQENREAITGILSKTPEIPENCQWAMFLRNHDELTLEMVTEEERAYMYKAYAPDPRMKINVGIRRRLSPLLDRNRAKIELLNGLLFSLPATPILYYGDEIGMGDNIRLNDRDGVRTPMQWSAGKNAGFSDAPAEKLYAPVITDQTYGCQTVNVETQLSDPSSLLNWTKAIIKLRKRHKVFGRGAFELLNPPNRAVFAFIRQHEDETILVAANLSSQRQTTEFDLSRYHGRTPLEMLSQRPFERIGASPYVLDLQPHSFYWLLI
jgi:maltose alpha-D-glucosyltransferase/alpha-amylase